MMMLNSQQEKADISVAIAQAFCLYTQHIVPLTLSMLGAEFFFFCRKREIKNQDQKKNIEKNKNKNRNKKNQKKKKRKRKPSCFLTLQKEKMQKNLDPDLGPMVTHGLVGCDNLKLTATYSPLTPCSF